MIFRHCEQTLQLDGQHLGRARVLFSSGVYEAEILSLQRF
jgi:hypothetical protein